MDEEALDTLAWRLVNCSAKVCKPLLWLHDSDSPQRLATDLREPLREALTTVVGLPDALSALSQKMCSIYNVAMSKPLVGVGASPFAKRLGERTAREGLMAALDFAKKHREAFESRAKRACSAGDPDWDELFALTEEFIDRLDWGAFVLDNARGQAACLVLECIELLEAVSNKDSDNIREETGDVFYNLMAFSLSLRLRARHLLLTSE